MNIAIIFAGGVGIRMGAGMPKQFIEISGKPVLIHTLELFEEHPEIDKIYMALLEDYIPQTEKLLKKFNITKVAGIVPGGETGLDSIYNALKKAQSENPDDSIVLIHDGVRPNITPQTITNNIEGVKEFGSAITTTACFETILMSKDGVNVEAVPSRKDMFAAQAPQSFRLGDIIEANDKIRNTPERYTDIVDSCNLMMRLGISTHIVEGNRGNIKVTTPEDVYTFRALLQHRENKHTFGF